MSRSVLHLWGYCFASTEQKNCSVLVGSGRAGSFENFNSVLSYLRWAERMSRSIFSLWWFCFASMEQYIRSDLEGYGWAEYCWNFDVFTVLNARSKNGKNLDTQTDECVLTVHIVWVVPNLRLGWHEHSWAVMITAHNRRVRQGASSV